MRSRKKRQAHKRYTQEFERHILALINDWPAEKRLQWDRIVSLVKKDTGHQWTRQTLEKKEAIRRAYDEHRAHYEAFVRTGQSPKLQSAETLVERQKQERLENENKSLRETLRASDERFVRYIANAIRFGVTQEQLESPVPKIE